MRRNSREPPNYGEITYNLPLPLYMSENPGGTWRVPACRRTGASTFKQKKVKPNNSRRKMVTNGRISERLKDCSFSSDDNLQLNTRRPNKFQSFTCSLFN